MLFNRPIPRALQPRFSEGSSLASVRDARATARQWTKNRTNTNQDVRNGEAVQAMARELTRLRRRQTGYLDQSVSVLPFQIYNINNATNSNLNAQTFQIRDGLVGFRPQYVYPDFNIAGIAALVASGNYEAALISVGTDGVGSTGLSDSNISFNENGNGADFSQVVSVNTGGSIVLLQVDFAPYPVLICSNQVGTAKPTGVQIVIQPNAGQSFSVSFFIKIVDAPAGPYTELWASVYDPGRTPAISNFSKSIPNHDQTLSIGIVTINESGNAIISQAQYGHLFNRYLELSPNPTGNASQGKFYGLPQVNRGKWTGNNLSGKIFYPGDQIIDDTRTFAVGANPPGPLFLTYKLWTYVGAGGQGSIGVETAVPSLGKWLPTGLTPTT